MIVKLKCISNIDFSGDTSDYLTVGKVYDGIKSEVGDIALVCDEGALIHDNVDECFHAKWEVVQ
ncbi:hypothetical protein [Proteus mirabilis]|uniref:hypothetical protein n=1 Tax=Proteus mirabilis TaxID=584 RepID=UPI0035579E5F